VSELVLVAVLLVAGAVCEVAGIALGALEIGSTRTATSTFLNRMRSVLGSGSGGVEITGSARLTMSGPAPAPTIDERLTAVESRLDLFADNLKALPEELRESWQRDLALYAESRARETRELRGALRQFMKDFDAGHGRRWAVVLFLLAGTALQVVGGVTAVWAH
jgi:hypothetical protein